jgi:hypothetical protein
MNERRINPFCPNGAIAPGMFAGRFEEIKAIETSLIQAKGGNPVNLLITGERGIGKTSLLQYAEVVAEGHLSVESVSFKFLISSVSLTSRMTRKTLIKLIEREVARKLSTTEKARSFIQNTWSFVKRIEVSGTKISTAEQEQEDELMLDDFAWAILQTAKRITADEQDTFSAAYDGIVILVDEADNAPAAIGLGEFLKTVQEKLQKGGVRSVFFILAGLPNVRDVLKDSHESSLRLFEDHALGRLEADEVEYVIKRCLDSSFEKCGRKTTIDDEAKAELVRLADGYPHFIQQFGYSAFNADEDGHIDMSDVIRGAFGNGGALELIGSRYYSDDFFNKIKSDSYRSVLRVMAEDMDSWVSRQNIKRKFDGADTTLTNALKVLSDRGIIERDQTRQGYYRLKQKGFAWWILLLADKQEQKRRATKKRPQLVNP